MKLAQFPWDPKPEPQAAPAAAHPQAAAAPAPSAPPASATYTQSTLSPQTAAQTLSLPGALLPGPNSMGVKQEQDFSQGDPTIKQEPGMQPMPQGYNPPNGARPGTAAHRAALALESQYGQRAAASISAIHSGMASQANPAVQPQQGQRPGPPPPHMNQQQYRQGVAAAMQQRMQQQQQQVPGQRPANGLPTDQLDGSSEAADAPSLEPGSEAAQPPTMDRAQIDAQFHAQIAARAKQMEGGGLMLPLKEATKTRGVAGKTSSADGPSQLDGIDDDVKSEEDEDAINSDLDDPDEVGDDDEDDDDSLGHMMLCMYDKVQRVKNKWYVTWADCYPSRLCLLTPSLGSASSRTVSSPSTARNTSSTRPPANTSGRPSPAGLPPRSIMELLCSGPGPFRGSTFRPFPSFDRP